MKTSTPQSVFTLAKLLLSACIVIASSTLLASEIATLRQGTPLESTNTTPALLNNASNEDKRKTRAYPMQPPTIPHKIEAYQIDTNANQCMTCHARLRVEDSQAPMIGVTHYMDRDGNFLADVSPRRYFCTQCHVTQVSNKPLIENTFRDMHHLPANKNKTN